jgi:tetratricopeptide (TPR) repeat protein
VRKGLAKKKIVFLAADPSNADRLRLMAEVREILEGLRMSRHREDFDFEPILAVRTRDLQQALRTEEPQIVHFSGHGTPAGQLLVEDTEGKAHSIAPAALADLFSLCTQHVECVLLNACYSEIQAQAIAEHIPYVIGTSTAIADRAAIAFSIGFYRALGDGMSFDEAFKWGRNQFRLDFPDEVPPSMKAKPGGLHARTASATLARMTRDQLSQLAQEYKRMLADGREEAETHCGLGAIYLQLGLYDLAVQHLKRTIERDPSLADGYYLLALAGIRGNSLRQLTLQDARAIESYLSAALQIDDTRAQYYYLLALVKEGYYAANGLRSTSPGAAELLASARSRIADPGEVERLLRALPLLDPTLAAKVQAA